jgi:hypothetical protein
MRRKRLKHATEAMCQIFCGWRLDTSKPTLVKLGSGVLEIDALTGQCAFSGEPAVELPIAKELHLWLQQELVNSKIPVSALL